MSGDATRIFVADAFENQQTLLEVSQQNLKLATPHMTGSSIS
jgi:hypothetical protein